VSEDHLEAFLDKEWPARGIRKNELVAFGDGFEELGHLPRSCRTAATAPPFVLQAVLENLKPVIKWAADRMPIDRAVEGGPTRPPRAGGAVCEKSPRLPLRSGC
jgi:hypothetical protein